MTQMTSNQKFATFLQNIDNTSTPCVNENLLDKNGKIDKYYLSFIKHRQLGENPNEYNPLLLTSTKNRGCLSHEIIVPKEKVVINVYINSIKDIIQLTKTYPLDETKEYNINMVALHNIVEPLIELDNMIGMKSIKENIVDQILYYLQNLHKVKNNSNDYMHTVIYGPPGTGKTEVARIIGKIYSNLGILEKKTFKKVTRSDLIAGFLGQTAIKTRDVIKESLGGVLFIDEAYSLGNNEKKDSFSKECIDTLCEALSDHKDELMVIIAGYETELNDCFFNYNQGLKSRFNWRFKVDNYTAEELYQIFFKKVTEAGWSIVEKAGINVKWFEKNMVYFKYFGRDIEVLFAKIKISHSRRVFCKPAEEKTIITIEDLEKGFELYLQNNEVKNRKEDESKKSMMNFYI
jgi:SpoVK/Ycf46/Vps4 family AAA+-type ATPase